VSCLHPITAWRDRKGQRSDGRWPLTFDPEEGHPGEKLQLPCGQCVECRLARSRAWAIRCVHEAQMHQDNVFITLTYSPEELKKCCPKGSLNKREFVLFMKRLRKECGSVRFFHAGEYGEKLGRPHHHACLFGLDFEDKKPWQIRNGIQLFTSETLERIWGHGYCVIGDVNFDSAAYVARYIMKKITGEMAEDHYQGKIPEYTTMSRRPGIGKSFLDKYTGDIYTQDRIILKERSLKPPRYYDNIYEAMNPEGFEKIKLNRKEKNNNKPKKTKLQKITSMLNAKKITIEKNRNNTKNRGIHHE